MDLPPAHICSVLVVDDDDDLRVVLARMAERDGFATAHARDGAAALERISAEAPDVIVLDLHMPGMDGYEFLRRKNGDAALAPIPVVVITSDPAAEPPYGTVALLRKPLDRAEFLQVLSDVL